MKKHILEQLILFFLCHVATGRKIIDLKAKTQSAECDLPSLPDRVDYQRNREGTRIFFECESGYKTLGAEFADCQDGLWSSDPPICIARRCPITYSIEHGRVVLSYSGALVRYTCDAPFQIEGASVLVCDGRKWNGTVPQCVDPNDRGSEISYTKSDAHKTHVDWLEESDYSCVKLKGSIRPPKVSHAQSITKWTLVDGKPRLYTLYRCEWGHVSRGKSKYMYCRKGEWTGGLPKCVETATSGALSLPRDQSPRKFLDHDGWLELADYTCMGTSGEPQRVVPEPVPHGTYVLRYAMVEGTPRLYAMMRCDFGYKLAKQDVQNMYCKEKSWIGQAPKCVTDNKAKKSSSRSCDYGNGGCDHTCTSSTRGVTCGCRDGYELNSDGRSCVDIDECNSNNGGCEQVCRNSDGSFHCHCHVGYVLAANGRSCEEAQWAEDGEMIPPMALFHL